MPSDRLLAAKQRLDQLAYYPRPVRIDGVRLLVSPRVFKLPWLCHVWQMQHRPLRMPLSYALLYETNPYELQARRAAAATRSTVSTS